MASRESDGAREASSRPLQEPSASALAARRPFQAAAGQATQLDYGLSRRTADLHGRHRCRPRAAHALSHAHSTRARMCAGATVSLLAWRVGACPSRPAARGQERDRAAPRRRSTCDAAAGHLGRRCDAPSQRLRVRSALPLAAGLRQSAAPRSASAALSRERTRAVRGVASCPAVLWLCRSHPDLGAAWCGEAWLSPAEGLIAAPRQTMTDLAAGGCGRAGQTSIGAVPPGAGARHSQRQHAGGWGRIDVASGGCGCGGCCRAARSRWNR